MGPPGVAGLVEQPAVLGDGVEDLCCLGGLGEPQAQIGQCGFEDVEWARDGDVVDRGDGCAEVVDLVRVWRWADSHEGFHPGGCFCSHCARDEELFWNAEIRTG